MTLGEIADIAASGLAAQRTRITVTASNLANAETTRTPEGGPYRRRDPVFVAERARAGFGDRLRRELRSVRVERVVTDPRDFVIRHQPGHPDADEKGFVRFPRVNVVEEQTNLLSASRAFEANLMLLRKVRQMGEAALRIGGGS